MKKTYSKPEFIFESFRLSANIAVGCEEVYKHYAEYECAYEVTGVGKVFLQEMVNCEYKGADGDYSICYHNPTDGTNLFTS